MKKRNHLQTKFMKFLIEKHTKDDPYYDIPSPEEDEERELKKKKKTPKLIPIDYEEVEEEDDEENDDEYDEERAEDDEVIEKLLNEYRNLKKKHESKLHQRK